MKVYVNFSRTIVTPLIYKNGVSKTFLTFISKTFVLDFTKATIYLGLVCNAPIDSRLAISPKLPYDSG